MYDFIIGIILFIISILLFVIPILIMIIEDKIPKKYRGSELKLFYFIYMFCMIMSYPLIIISLLFLGF